MLRLSLESTYIQSSCDFCVSGLFGLGSRLASGLFGLGSRLAKSGLGRLSTVEVFAVDLADGQPFWAGGSVSLITFKKKNKEIISLKIKNISMRLHAMGKILHLGGIRINPLFVDIHRF